jgi:hypothetical protein
METMMHHLASSGLLHKLMRRPGYATASGNHDNVPHNQIEQFEVSQRQRRHDYSDGDSGDTCAFVCQH